MLVKYSKTIGFTLAEVLTVVAILGLMTALAIPSYYEMVKNNAVRSDIELLFSAISYAKITSIKETKTIKVCAVQGESAATCSKVATWNKWAVVDDSNNILKHYTGKTDISASGIGYVVFENTGFNKSTITFGAQPEPCKGKNRRELVVNMAGSINIQREKCQ